MGHNFFQMMEVNKVVCQENIKKTSSNSWLGGKATGAVCLFAEDLVTSTGKSDDGSRYNG